MSQARRVQKIKGVLSAIDTYKWESFNDFLLAFYTSKDQDVRHQASRSIAYTPGQRFAPETILDIWLDRATSDTKHHLHRIITERAANIMIAESTRACRHDALQVPSSKINIPYLSTDFGLKHLAAMYQTLLPCLWLLLTMLMTASNDYETKTGREKENKDSRASSVSAICSSHAVFH